MLPPISDSLLAPLFQYFTFDWMNMQPHGHECPHMSQRLLPQERRCWARFIFLMKYAHIRLGLAFLESFLCECDIQQDTKLVYHVRFGPMVAYIRFFNARDFINQRTCHLAIFYNNELCPSLNR